MELGKNRNNYWIQDEFEIKRKNHQQIIESRGKKRSWFIHGLIVIFSFVCFNFFRQKFFFHRNYRWFCWTGLPVKILIANLKIDIWIITNDLCVFSICRLLSYVVHRFLLPEQARTAQPMSFLIEENGNNNKMNWKQQHTHKYTVTVRWISDRILVDRHRSVSRGHGMNNNCVRARNHDVLKCSAQKQWRLNLLPVFECVCACERISFWCFFFFFVERLFTCLSIYIGPCAIQTISDTMANVPTLLFTNKFVWRRT